MILEKWSSAIRQCSGNHSGDEYVRFDFTTARTGKAYVFKNMEG